MGSEHTSGQITADELPCPICPTELGIETMVEPEIDGDHKYYECQECGYAFGYERLNDANMADAGSCQIGVPEEVRRGASEPMEKALAAQAGPAVPLGLTIGKRPGL